MDTHFDVLILGTGTTQAITAAALSKAGFKVLHVDINSYYGGAEATFAQDEFIDWVKAQNSSSLGSTTTNETPLPFARSYSLSLAPSLIPSSGPLIDALINSGVSRYGKFKLLDAIFIARSQASQHDSVSHSEFTPPTQLLRAPNTKEDIFRSREISLIDKRKLMRFLQFAAGEFEGSALLRGLDGQRTQIGVFLSEQFSLKETARDAIIYALACCEKDNEPVLPVLSRIRKYIRSSGRYGNSPFLVGHYGGLGELSQGFCRTSAVNGSVYILGRNINALCLPTTSESESKPASIELQDVPDVLTADIVITDRTYLSHVGNLEHHENNSGVIAEQSEGTSCAYGIVILNQSVSFPQPSSSDPLTPAPETEADGTAEEPPASAVIVFPPRAAGEGAVRILQMGDETLSCPAGKYILYACSQIPGSMNSASNSEPLNPQAYLMPYIKSITALENIEFSCFYTKRDTSFTETNQIPPAPRTLLVSSLPSSWSEIGDTAARDAEELFWKAVNLKREMAGGNAEDDQIESMWPPLERVGDDDEW
ncbi:FAD/NAD-P-binding domain-containing protein [Hysterangium stoloniferum]|nr:FAD/NAD-P-binding domain-containing protein [Hysterangium stoloniferum]